MTLTALTLVMGMALCQVPALQTAPIGDAGSISWNTTIVADPDTARLYALSEMVLKYIGEKLGAPSPLQPKDYPFGVMVVSYAVYEDHLLEILDLRDALMATRIRGDQALIDGHTSSRLGLGFEMYFYQWPNDPIYVHEYLHVLYPNLVEREIMGMQAEVLTSRVYKDWLRSNY